MATLVAALAALAGLAFLSSSILADDDELQAIIDPAPHRAPDRSDRAGDRAAAVGRLRGRPMTARRSGTSTCVLPGDRTMRIAPGHAGRDRPARRSTSSTSAVCWPTCSAMRSCGSRSVPQTARRDRGAATDRRPRRGVRRVRERLAHRLPAGDRAGVRRHRHPELQRLPPSDYGPDSVSILDLNLQQVTAVRCGDEVTPDPVPATSAPDVAGATSVPDPAGRSPLRRPCCA